MFTGIYIQHQRQLWELMCLVVFSATVTVTAVNRAMTTHVLLKETFHQTNPIPREESSSATEPHGAN